MLVINIIGFSLIALIVWWFWFYKPKEIEVGESEFVIIVENGTYTPSRIKLPAGKELDLIFLRKDQSPCSETLLIPNLQISELLPFNKSKAVHLPALVIGEYDFHCQMQMYRGHITVE